MTNVDQPVPAVRMSAATVDFLMAWQALEGASRRVREDFAREAGLGLIDFQALVFLSAEDGRPSKAVGTALHLSSGAMTALLDRLESAGFIKRGPHPSDRRSTLLHLTEVGAVTATAAGALFAKVTESTIPAAELTAATRLFQALAARLDEHAPH